MINPLFERKKLIINPTVDNCLNYYNWNNKDHGPCKIGYEELSHVFLMIQPYVKPTLSRATTITTYKVIKYICKMTEVTKLTGAFVSK